MLTSILPYIQISVSILLIAAILLQKRGTGLGSGFGGAESASYATRRGAENVIFWATIVLALAFLASALASIVLK